MPTFVRGYVSNAAGGANDVSIFDTVGPGYTFVTTTTVGTVPHGVAVLPNNNLVFVCNSTASTVSVIDTTTNLVVHTVAVGTTPFQCCASPDSAFVYVTNNGSSNVTRIDTSTFATTTLAVASNPYGCVVSPDNTSLWVSLEGNGTVVQISTASFTVVNTVTIGALGNLLHGCAITPNGAFLWVCNRGTNQVSIINTAALTFVQIAVAGAPEQVAIRPDGLFAFVSRFSGSLVSVIDTTLHTTAATISTGTQPFGLALTPDGTTGFVCNNSSGTNTVTVFQQQTPWGILATLAGGYSFANPLFIGIVTKQPVRLTVPPLFIPRKGLAQYDRYDYEIDWRAIERWANSWAPTLFIPNKPEGIPNQEQLKENWTQIEVWAQGTARGVVVGAGLSFTPLFIPRKETMTPIDLTTNWNTIQNWGNLPP